MKGSTVRIVIGVLAGATSVMAQPRGPGEALDNVGRGILDGNPASIIIGVIFVVACLCIVGCGKK